jgi:hypothetical protein
MHFFLWLLTQNKTVTRDNVGKIKHVDDMTRVVCFAVRMNLYIIYFLAVVGAESVHHKSAEIYLLMADAKQLVTLGLSWFQPGSYVQQWCARGTILRCTVVLAEGATSEAGEEAEAPGPRGF